MVVFKKWLVNVLYKSPFPKKLTYLLISLVSISFIIVYVQRILHLDLYKCVSVCHTLPPLPPEFKQMTETPADLTTDGESYWILIITLTSMTLNFLTKKSKDWRMLACFWWNKSKRSQSQFFLCFKYKSKLKIFKDLHQFLKTLKNTYSVVTLIPEEKFLGSMTIFWRPGFET